MKKTSVLYLLLLMMILTLTVAACGATATPTVRPPTPTKAQAAATTQVQPAASFTAPPATATAIPQPAATATPIAPPAATTAPTRAPAVATAPAADARSSVIKAMEAQMAGKSYRARQTVQSSGATTESVVEFVPPDRYHTTTSAGPAGFEMIIIGKKAYQKQGTAWMVFPMDIGAMIESLTSAASEEAIKGISDVKLVGPELLDGAPMLVYTYASKFKLGDIESTSTVKMWVGALDNLPRKQIVEGEAMGVKSTTTQLIEYDPAIKIEAPM